MAGKLIFSFDKNLTIKEMHEEQNFQFGMGFFDLSVKVDGEEKVHFTEETIKTSPLVEITLSNEAPVSLPSKKREFGSSTTTDISTIGDKRQKFEVAEKTITKESVVRFGTISEEEFAKMTRTQRKTILRRARRRCARARKAALESMSKQIAKRTEMIVAEENLAIPPTLPLLIGSKFHPLLASEGEESVAGIVGMTSCPTSHPKNVKEDQVASHSRATVKTVGHKKDETKEEYVHRVKNLLARNTARRVINKEFKKNPIKIVPVKRVPEQVSGSRLNQYPRSNAHNKVNQHQYKNLPEERQKGALRPLQPYAYDSARTQRPPRPLVHAPRMDEPFRFKIPLVRSEIVKCCTEIAKDEKSLTQSTQLVRVTVEKKVQEEDMEENDNVRKTKSSNKLEIQKKGSRIPDAFTRPPVEAYDPTVPLDIESLRPYGHTLSLSNETEAVVPPRSVSPVATTLIVAQEDCILSGDKNHKSAEESLRNHFKLLSKVDRKEKARLDEYLQYKNLKESNPDIFKDSILEEIYKDLEEEFGETIKNFDPQEDDLMDDGMEYPSASIYMVDTRGTSQRARHEEDEVEVSDNRPTDQVNQLREKDQHILELERKLTEMMSAMSAMQKQLSASQLGYAEVAQPAVARSHQVEEREHVYSHVKATSESNPSEKDIKQMIENQVREALAKSQGASSIPKGRPYPEEYDLVAYPKGFVLPTYKTFNGTGNPKQHLAHFRASCCNAGGSDALLFRQFVNSLTGIAFDWFADLPNGSVKYFTELETLFMKRFAGAQHHVTVGDLVMEKQTEGEALVDYILRWRNMSMKCEPQLQEQHAVEILLKNIHGPIAFLLKGFTIRTFEKLLIKANNLQAESAQIAAFAEQNEKKFQKQSRHFDNKKTGHVSAVEKGKKPMQIQNEIEDLPQGPRPRQVSNIPSKPFAYTTTFEERMNKVYSFKREAVKRMFRSVSKSSNFQLPEPKYPKKPGDREKPNFYLYHQSLGHATEDCFTFKDWLERNYQKGFIQIPQEYLVKGKETGTVNVISGIDGAPRTNSKD